MRKINVLLLTFFLIISSIGAAGAAEPSLENNKKEVIFEQKEILNLEILEDRARKGISDIEKAPVNFGTTLIGSNNEQVKLNTVETTQKLKIEKDGQGNITTTYATTVFADTAKKSEDKKISFLESIFKIFRNTFGVKSAYAASQTLEEEGASLSVKSYSTIYWTQRTYNGTIQYRLDRVTGGWIKQDSQVSMSNRKVEYGSTGFTNVSRTAYPTTNTFDYTTDSSFVWEQKGSASVIGCTTYITITRGTSSWVQKLVNNE